MCQSEGMNVRKTSLTFTLVALISGCAGGSSIDSQAVTIPSSPCNTTQATPNALVTLILSVPQSVVLGTAATITATGVDAAGNRSDVTNVVTWTSSNLLAASAGDGAVYGIGAGDVVIRATLGEITAAAAVTIVPVTLTSLEMRADAEVAAAGSVTAWHVIGHYNDGSTADLTASAAWSSSDERIATIGEPGQVLAVASGMAMVTAASDGLDASQPMLVQ